MRIRFILRSVLVSTLLLFSFSLCRAQTVPGNVTYTFGTNNDGTQLWDLTGGYSANITVVQNKTGVQVPVTLGFTILQDASGNLRGVPGDLQGITINGSAFFGASYTLSGKVTGSGGNAEARFVVRFFGNGSVGGFQNVNFSAVLTVDAAPVSGDGQLEGSAKFSASFGQHFEGINGVISDFAAPFPAGVDGSWTLNLQMLGDRSLAGTATITTDAGQVLGFNVSGPLNATGAIARLRALRGGLANQTISGVGSSVTIAPDDLTFDSGLLSGKVMGQKFVPPIELPPPD